MATVEHASVVSIIARIVGLADGRLEFGLRPGASADAIAAAEAMIGLALPGDVREFYLAYDGQERLAHGLLFGYPIAPLAEAVAQWAVNTSLEDEVDNNLTPTGDERVQQLPLHRKWFPISSYQGADELLIDTDPTSAGVTGQVIRGGYEVVDRHAVAPSLSALLVQVVHAFQSNLVQIDRGHGQRQTVWGLAPGARAPWLTSSSAADAPSGAAAPAWLAEVDAAWREWFDARGPRFSLDFERGTRVTQIPAGASNLDPLAQVHDLNLLDLAGYHVQSLTEVPASATLASLSLGTADSLDGIRRFPSLTTLTIRQSPGIDLAPLAAAQNLLTLRVEAPAVNHGALVTLTRLTRIRTTARSTADLDDVLSLNTLAALMIDAAGLDAGDTKRWPGMTRLSTLALSGAVIDDLYFLKQLPALRSLELCGMRDFSLSGIADLPLVRIVLTDVDGVRDADELNSVAEGTRIALPLDLWEDVKRPDSPFALEYFTDNPRTA